MIPLALLSLLVGFSGAVIPGPLFAVAVQQGLTAGWSAGFWLMNGHAVGELALLFAIRAGLGRQLQRPLITRIIGLLGGAVLLYLAWDMVATALAGLPDATGPTAAQPAMSCGMLMLKGFLLSTTNPAWYIWWATVGIGLISSQLEKQGLRAWPAFFLGHISADYIWYLGVTILVAAGGKFLHPAAHRALIVTCGLAIAVIGTLFVFRALRAWHHAASKTVDALTDS